jgi:hypothetical protein
MKVFFTLIINTLSGDCFHPSGITKAFQFGRLFLFATNNSSIKISKSHENSLVFKYFSIRLI